MLVVYLELQAQVASIFQLICVYTIHRYGMSIRLPAVLAGRALGLARRAAATTELGDHRGEARERSRSKEGEASGRCAVDASATSSLASTGHFYTEGCEKLFATV